MSVVFLLLWIYFSMRVFTHLEGFYAQEKRLGFYFNWADCNLDLKKRLIGELFWGRARATSDHSVWRTYCCLKGARGHRWGADTSSWTSEDSYHYSLCGFTTTTWAKRRTKAKIRRKKRWLLRKSSSLNNRYVFIIYYNQTFILRSRFIVFMFYSLWNSAYGNHLDK